MIFSTATGMKITLMELIKVLMLKTSSDRSNSYNLDESESNVTRAIRASIERNSHVNMKNSETSFKQVLDLAMNVVNELPTMVNVTGKTINKMIVKGKEGIESINNFKNNMSYSCKDRS